MSDQNPPQATIPDQVLVSINQWLALIAAGKAAIENVARASDMTFDEAVALAVEKEAAFEAKNNARISELETKLGGSPTSEPTTE
ncbi:MAG: hypothetical protein ABI977_11940 [Acidobacteriota bacterium]